MNLYVLVPTSVYDHGITGVYGSEEDARDVATSIWRKTDGHHAFKIVKVELDATYPFTFDYTFCPDSGKTVAPDSDPNIFVVSGSKQRDDD